MGKFKFTDIFLNESGKSSASGFCGTIIIACGLLGFIVGVADKIFASGNIEIINQSIVLVTLGIGLLSVRKANGTRKRELPI